jgi:hypothetical protein
MSSAESETGGSPSRILWILGGAILLLCAVFGWRTVDARNDFDDYRQSTLVDGAAELPWQDAEMGVEACIDYALEWALECPAMDTWCHNYLPEVLAKCLDSQSREIFCQEGTTQSFGTSYGYAQCEERVSRVEEKYRKRTTKKLCVRAKKAVLAYCAR